MKGVSSVRCSCAVSMLTDEPPGLLQSWYPVQPLRLSWRGIFWSYVTQTDQSGLNDPGKGNLERQRTWAFHLENDVVPGRSGSSQKNMKGVSSVQWTSPLWMCTWHSCCIDDVTRNKNKCSVTVCLCETAVFSLNNCFFIASIPYVQTKTGWLLCHSEFRRHNTETRRSVANRHKTVKSYSI